MATRQTYYAESLANSNNTTVTYAQKVAITFTPDASSSYLILASANINNASNLTDDAKVRLRDVTNGVDLALANIESKDITDFQPFIGMDVMTYGATPVSTTFEISFAAETAGNSINIRDAYILAIKLDATDQFVVSDATQTTTSNTFQTKTGAALTFTPATAGDYLILASADSANLSDGDEWELRLLDDTSTAVGLMQRANKDSTNWLSWGTMIRKALTAASKTFTVQFRNRTTGGDTVSIRNARVIALRLDAFAANYYAEARASATTTVSASYQDRAALTATPAAGDHLVFLAGQHQSRSASIAGRMAMVEGSTVLAESLQEGVQATVWSDFPMLVAAKRTLAASSTTWKVQYRANSGSPTIESHETAIAVLQLASAAGGQTVTAALVSDADGFYGATVAPGAVSIAGGLVADADNFYSASVVGSAVISGALFSDGDAFFGAILSAGSVIAGGLVVDADGFYAATVTPSYSLGGGLFTDQDTFFAGSIAVANGPQAITGLLFANSQAFQTASIVTTDPEIRTGGAGGGGYYTSRDRAAENRILAAARRADADDSRRLATAYDRAHGIAMEAFKALAMPVPKKIPDAIYAFAGMVQSKRSAAAALIRAIEAFQDEEAAIVLLLAA